MTDRLTLRELVALIEEARGVNFDIVYDGLDKLKNGKITELPGHAALYDAFPRDVLQGVFAGFERMIVEGVFDLKPLGGTLNEVFPNIRAKTARELVWAAWKA